MPENAYIPAAMSAIDTPTFEGTSGVPVIETRPASLCTSRSYAFLSRYGPSVPYPEISQITSRGCCACSAAEAKPRRSSRPAPGCACNTSARDEQATQHVGRFRPLEIERQRFLRPVDPDEVTGQALDRAVVAAREVAAARPLDLDDPRAEIGELAAGKRRGHRLLDRDDEYASTAAMIAGSACLAEAVRRRRSSRFDERLALEDGARHAEVGGVDHPALVCGRALPCGDRRFVGA